MKNKFAIPGFIDAHMHLDELGEFIKGINLKETTSKKTFAIIYLKKKINLKHGYLVMDGLTSSPP